jgi:hypothetical protein
MIRGDWEDVQVAFGLLPERVTPRPHLDVLGRLGIKVSDAERPSRSAGAAAAARRKEDKRRKAKRASLKRRK